MSAAPPPERRRSRRQVFIGLLAIPLSVLPFAAYANLTPEGRLLRDRVRVALDSPQIPALRPIEAVAVREIAPRYRDAVMPLVYHGIGGATDGGTAVTPERFAEHLAALREAGFKAVTASEVARAFTGGRRLPAKAVMITFDDGRSDAILWADPLLADAGMKATMFVIGAAADEPGVYYAGWERLAGLARSGRWDLQSHTAGLHREQRVDGRSYPALTSRLADETLADYRDRVATDLDAIDDALRERTGRAPVGFAYPFGAYGADRTNDRRIQGVLADEVGARYDLAFHQDEQDTVPVALPTDDRLGIRRLDVGDWSGVDLVAAIAGAAKRTDFPTPRKRSDRPTSPAGPAVVAARASDDVGPTAARRTTRTTGGADGRGSIAGSTGSSGATTATTVRRNDDVRPGTTPTTSGRPLPGRTTTTVRRPGGAGSPTTTRPPSPPAPSTSRPGNGAGNGPRPTPTTRPASPPTTRAPSPTTTAKPKNAKHESASPTTTSSRAAATPGAPRAVGPGTAAAADRRSPLRSGSGTGGDVWSRPVSGPS